MEWQTAAGQLKAHLPPEDAVLAHWFRALQDFKTKLPLLHKLHHESLKVKMCCFASNMFKDKLPKFHHGFEIFPVLYDMSIIQRRPKLPLFECLKDIDWFICI